jgi:hypothetical protein
VEKQWWRCYFLWHGLALRQRPVSTSSVVVNKGTVSCFSDLPVLIYTDLLPPLFFARDFWLDDTGNESGTGGYFGRVYAVL